MTCVRCSSELQEASAFCRFCGASTGAGRPAAARRFARIPGDGRIGGVCAGISAYMDSDVTLVRLLWVLLSIVPGAFIGGIIAYAAAWLLMPVAGAGDAPVVVRSRLVRSASNRTLGGVCGGLGEYFGVDPTLVRVVAVILAIYPGAIVLGVLAYVVAWLIIPEASAPPLQPAASPV